MVSASVGLSSAFSGGAGAGGVAASHFPRCCRRWCSSNSPSWGDLDVSSPSNKNVKMIRRYGMKRRERDADGVVVLEGVRLVLDALELGVRPQCVLVSEDALNGSHGQDLIALLDELPADVVLVATQEAVARACNTVSPQGLVALVDRPSIAIPDPDKMSLLLICNGVQDPGNLGTLIRTAAGVGCDAVFMVGPCADVWGPKCLRSSMGATFRIPVKQFATWQDARQMLPSDFSIFAADGGATLEYFKAPLHQRCALVVGGEGEGICNDIKDEVSRGLITGLRIPLELGVESYNAAVAGSIVLAESQRQRFGGT
jgi:tRNA G18 (ribose-2'-O)-methylase SpoU